jgi:hypothetical protein
MLVIGERCHRRLRTKVAPKTEAKPFASKVAGKRRSSVHRMHRLSTVAVGEFLDPEKKGVGEVHKDFLGSRYAEFLGDWKCPLLITFIFLTLGSLVLSIQNLEQAAGVPQVFQADHNQVLGKEYDGKFATFDETVAFKAAASATECNNIFEDCAQYRCETTGRPMGSPTDCQCYPQYKLEGECANPPYYSVDFRILGRPGLPVSAVNSANLTAALAVRFPNAKKIKFFPRLSGWRMVSEVLVENWESGRQRLAVMVNPGYSHVTVRDAIPSDVNFTECLEQQICYCGIERADGAGPGLGYGSLNISSSGGRRLTSANGVEETYPHPLADPVSARQLQSSLPAGIKPSEVVDVNIIFGLKVTGSFPLLGVAEEAPWEYDPTFNLKDPWAQRCMLKLCESMAEDESLAIGGMKCWLMGFQRQWVGKGVDYQWPLRSDRFSIDNEVILYANTALIEGIPVNTFIWIGETGSDVLATYFPFYLNQPKSIGADEAMVLKERWDEYVDNQEFSQYQECSGWPYAGAWHASALWRRAEAQKVILDSTLVTLGISLGCVFMGVVLFTFSFHLALLVATVVLAIIMCLLFFMTTMMEWPIGAIEVLSLIVFVGFAVDYCLHVAHKYHMCHITEVEDLPAEEEVVSTGSVEDRYSMSSAFSQLSGSATSASGTGSHMGSHMGLRESMRSSYSRRRSGGRQSIRMGIADIASKKPQQLEEKHQEILVKNRPQERYERTRYALERMGGAVMGSALTTIGCAAFLLPCQLAVFVKIGSVVVAVTCFAIVYTVIPLPALLMQCGPCQHDTQVCIAAILKLYNRLKKGEDTTEADDGPQVPRRYVLHMPTRAMSVPGCGTPATRTRVTATG